MTRASEDMEKVEPLYVSGQNVKWFCTVGSSLVGNVELPYDQAIPLQELSKRTENRDLKTCTCTFIAALFTIARW